jgi:uncharacterized membrane protein
MRLLIKLSLLSSIALVLIIFSTDNAFSFLQDYTLIQRSQKLLKLENINMFIDLLGKMKVEKMSMLDSYAFLSLDDNVKYDMSWFIRMHKWCFAIKSFIFHPHAYFIGLGPGFCGSALDGGLLRLLTENGVIGSFFFLSFFYKGCRTDPGMRVLFVTFLLYMTFIDIYLAYKAMSICFFLMGMFQSMQSQREEAEALEDKEELAAG